MALTQVQGGMILPSTTLTTPIVATTMGVGGATPAASGSGITFPATQSASSDANTLDDYEEGTFTPILFGLTSAGTTVYSDQVGYYTKIGNLVTLAYQVTVDSASGTGALALGGFPFTTSANGAGSASVMVNALNWGGGSFVQLYLGQSRTYAIPYYFADDANWNAQQVVNESQAYIATITYRV
jgi:hypothetical protein